ncbi:MAG: glycosyl hydrolase family 8, partial [Bacteroidales bacterium]
MFKKILYSFLIVTLHFSFSFGQVHVDINSGNPTFPFPQFLEYSEVGGEGKTLAKHNAEGVTHCDMEKTIREAWQIYANEFRYTGDIVDGVEYIKGNRGCPYDCTEGAGYSMLGAAYMADKTTFDGLWMRTHDHFMVKDARYIDGVINCPDYKWGTHTLAEACAEGSAGDGDWDIALALLVAYKQWGANSGITVNTQGGGTKEMNYFEEAYKVITSLVDTTRGYAADGTFVGYNSGSIGVDGYPKGGNKQREATNWAELDGSIKTNSEVMCGSMTGFCPGDKSFASYIAPSYYHSFADFLDSNGGTQWCIEQYRRAEASTDWVMGQIRSQGHLPYAGGFTPDASSVTFTEAPPVGTADGEGFRMAWRTILNGLWRGNGRYEWNPTTHQYTTGSTTHMKDNADAVAAFLKDNGICDALGMSPDPLSVAVNQKGVSQIRQYHSFDGGTPGPKNWTNFLIGSSSAAIAYNGDEQLIADIFRQLELKWDDKDPGLPDDAYYMDSEPVYFHGWFRLLGMSILSGNYHAPENIEAGANLKVYMSVNKTFAFVDDQVTYTLNYRNYGSLDAENSQIVIDVDPQYEIIDGGGGSVSGNTITYNIGTVPGFNSTDGIAPTTGSYSYTVKVVPPKISNRVCQTADISCSNGFGWTSNEYPNNCTYTMERNCVDILGTRSLLVNKYGNRTEVNPGMEVDFTVQFENSSEGGWLNGGRNHVNFTYGWSKAGPNAYFHLFRAFTNAEEAYIDLSNYRVSYFMFDNVNKG